MVDTKPNDTDRIITILEPKIHQLSRKWCPSFPDEEIEDLEQEARIEIFIKMERYNPASGSIESWGAKVITNRFRNMYEKNKAMKRQCETISLSTPVGRDEDGEIILLGDIIADPSPSVSPDSTVFWDRYSRIYMTLTLKEAEVLEMLMEGYSQKDISRINKESYSQTRSTVKHIRERFKEIQNK